MPIHLAAVGSSFASGPGIDPILNKAASRSARNYPHLLADRLGASLTDLTVAGATTATILDTPQRVRWHRFPPQLSQLPPTADLVTVTAGGNDLNYIGSMMTQAVRAHLAGRPLTRPLAPLLARGDVPAPTPAALRAVTTNLTTIVEAVRKQAPNARVLLVDYLTVLDADTPAAPLSPPTHAALREIAAALSTAFATAASSSGADLIPMGPLSQGHGIGSPVPWVRGFNPRNVPASFHPTFEGMAAVADTVMAHLDGQSPAFSTP
jgi:lysophospholipase L1-like esterase